MTQLRQTMLEELRRNYAESTTHIYIHTVEHFSRHFHRSPDQLGPEHIHLKIIVHWKSPRKIAYIDDNTDVEIGRALRFASDPRTSESSAIDVLDKLHGVGVPIASAILTMMFPEKYTIIDFRALKSLRVVKPPTDSIRYYVSYLAKCRELARKHKVSLRTLDRALWQWSKENGARETTCA